MLTVPALRYYRAYGLEISSELALPELNSSHGDGDEDTAVRILLEEPVPAPAAAITERCLRATADEVHLFWPQAGSFAIKAGREIVLTPVPGVDARLLRIGVLGPALATVLQQRGALVLHASAVSLQGKVVAFVGWKGQGKSTTAAGLFGRGHPLVTDDVLALDVADDKAWAQPSFPQFKLWPDSARHSLGDDPESLPALMENYDKRARSAAARFATQAGELAGIYVLGEGPELTTERLSQQETFKQLVTHTFCARYGAKLFLGRTGTTHLQNCGRVARTVPVFALRRPRSLAGLDQLFDFILQHAETL
jgi:hypothetical protein